MSAWRVGTTYWQTKRKSFASRVTLEQWQDQQVQRHLRRIVSLSKYHRELYRNHDLRDWKTLPVTDKQAMMTNFDDYNTLGIRRTDALDVARKAEQTRDFRPTLNGATVGLSSGTTGSYSLFLASSNENATFIGTALAKLLRGSVFQKHRIAFFHRAHSNLYQGLDSGRQRHVFFDLGEDLESQFGKLDDLQPTQVIGPPYVLRRLGEAVRAGRLSIAPTALLSVAEVLDAADRAQIEADFGLAVDQAYIATEGFIAATCTHGSLHINEDCLVVQREWLERESGRFIPIVTDFRRLVQPIVRYRLDDILVAGPESCRCGSPFSILESVEGRCDDVLFIRRQQEGQLRRVFPDFLRRSICSASAEIRDYRLRQTSPETVLISLDVAPQQSAECERAVLKSISILMDRLELERPQIVFTPYVDVNPRMKVRRIVREFEADVT